MKNKVNPRTVEDIAYPFNQNKKKGLIIKGTEIETRLDLTKKLAPYVDKDSITKLLSYCKMSNDHEMLREIDSILGMYAPKLWDSERPLIPAPSEEDLDGDIFLGTTYHGDIPICDFKFPSHFLLRHMGIYAQTGHAKTTVLYNLMEQIIEDNVPLTFFDPKKDGRVMLEKYEHYLAIPWYAFPWNPLRPPPGMPIKSWWANFSQICGFSFGWFVASSNYTQQHLDFLYDRYLETESIPTLHDLYSSIAQTSESSRRKSDYHDSVENRIKTLVSIFGNNLTVSEGIPLEVLCEKACSIELHGLRPAEANWFIEVILCWFYFYRLYQDQRGETLRHVIFVDECHRIFDKSKEYRQTAIEMGVPIIAIFPSQFRDLGTSLVMASQQPSQVMNTVNANTLIKICGNLSSGNDIDSISESMGLNRELTDYLHKLKRGQWIVRMSDGYTEPFLIETPDYPVVRDVTDEFVLERLESVFGQYSPDDQPKEAEVKPKLVLPQISDEAWSLLSNVNSHPFKGLTSRYKSLSFSGRRATSTKNELVDKKLVKEVGVKLGNYRPVKFLVLTDLAINVLRNIGHDVRLWKHTGHMGFHHQLYTVLIAYSYRNAGYKTYIEKTLDNKRRIDVLTIIGDKRVAIEVETGYEVDIKNKLTALEEVDKLQIITDNQNIINHLSRIDLPENVSVYTIVDYLRHLRSNYTTYTPGTTSNYSNNPKNQFDMGKKAGNKGK